MCSNHGNKLCSFVKGRIMEAGSCGVCALHCTFEMNAGFVKSLHVPVPTAVIWVFIAVLHFLNKNKQQKKQKTV